MLKSSIPFVIETWLSPSQTRYFQFSKVLFFVFAQILHYNTYIILYQDINYNIQQISFLDFFLILEI